MDITDIAANIVALVGGATIALIIGVVMVLLAKGYLPWGSFTKKTKDMLLIIGVVLTVAALLTMGILGGLGTGGAETTVTPTTQATFGLTITSSDSEITVDSVTHEVTWAINFNDTSDSFNSGTGSATLNLT
ncbi:MAG: hypothetical protein J7L32_05235, partial [Thermoplasmata archaeon]|nr:hypothetical protein [Thermoplasmata archaeon]